MTAISQQQPMVNNKALAWTIGVHCLLFMLFYFLNYSLPYPPPVDYVSGGMEVNLGTSDDGSGNNQPQSQKSPSNYQAAVVFKSVAVKSTLPKNIMQSTESDAPEVNNNNKKATPNPVNAPEHKAQKEEKPKYSYPGDNGQGGNNAAQNKPGTREGNGSGPGDKGVPGGTPGAPNYTGSPGSGGGNGGIGHNLSGRDIFPKQFEAEFNESGKVVVSVTVDRNGNIINKHVKSSSSAQLNKIALEQINKVKFTASHSPEPQQFGDVTIIFKTRQ